MMQVSIGFISANPIDEWEGRKHFINLRTERGGKIVIGELLLICDDCGADIEKGETYYKLEYPPWNAICEDCVMKAETVRGDEANYKIVSTETI